jgi:hypothetical protein
MGVGTNHRSRPGRLVALAIIGVGAIAVPGGRVHACSCAVATPFELASWADAAFVGTLTGVDRGEDEGTFRFDVETWLMGDADAPTIDVVSAADGSSCGIEVPVGGRAALFLTGEGGRWRGSLCATLDADATLAAIEAADPSVSGPVLAPRAPHAAPDEARGRSEPVVGSPTDDGSSLRLVPVLALALAGAAGLVVAVGAVLASAQRRRRA